MKTDNRCALRLQTHLLSKDRRLTGLAGPEYDATISFGLLFEPEDSQLEIPVRLDLDDCAMLRHCSMTSLVREQRWQP